MAIRAMQVEYHILLIAYPSRYLFPNSRCRLINAIFSIITVMVPRMAVLSLVTIFHTIFIDKRDEAELSVFLQPLIGNDTLDDTLHNIICCHFASVMTGGKKNLYLWLNPRLADGQHLHIPTFLGLGKCRKNKIRVLAIGSDKFIPIGLGIRNGESKTDLLIGSECIFEALRIICVGLLPLPALSFVRTYRNTSPGKTVVRELEGQGLSLSTIYGKVPIKPKALRIPQIWLKPNSIILHLFYANVTTRIVRMYPLRRCGQGG